MRIQASEMHLRSLRGAFLLNMHTRMCDTVYEFMQMHLRNLGGAFLQARMS